jgi:RNA polymerase sigma-70 factor (ECF subfamily)
MPDPERTRWSQIRRAAQGGESAREYFARTYEPVIRAYLASRWARSPLVGEIDDATQEVFLACFKEDGALGRVDPDRPGGFRPFLYGVVRNVARRVEERRGRRERTPTGPDDLAAVQSEEDSLSRVFDRAWAKAILKAAVQLHAERAAGQDDAAVRRVELLRLRFQEGLPIREIARRWEEDPARLHREYARSRREFAAALREVVKLHLPGSPAAVDAECAKLVEFFR